MVILCDMQNCFQNISLVEKNINEKGLGIADDGNDLNELKMINLRTKPTAKPTIGRVFLLSDDSSTEREV